MAIFITVLFVINYDELRLLIFAVAVMILVWVKWSFLYPRLPLIIFVSKSRI
jgi:hypothetical protein